MSRVSMRQMEILHALHRIGNPTEWGDVWDRVGWGGSPLEMLNFDRATGALERRGLVAYDADNLVKLTDDGRALVEIAKRGSSTEEAQLRCVRCATDHPLGEMRKPCGVHGCECWCNRASKSGGGR